MSASWYDTKRRCKQMNKKKKNFDKNFFRLFERCLCVGNVSITHRGSFVLLSFYGESLVIYRFSINFACLYFMISSKDIPASQRLKCSFFLLGIFQTNSVVVVAVEVHLVQSFKFFCRFKNVHRTARIFWFIIISI